MLYRRISIIKYTLNVCNNISSILLPSEVNQMTYNSLRSNNLLTKCSLIESSRQINRQLNNL